MARTERSTSQPTDKKPVPISGQHLLLFAGCALALSLVVRFAFTPLGLMGEAEARMGFALYFGIGTICALLAWGTRHGITVAGWRPVKKQTQLQASEEAVSPVIGVILMVAITVVLAAVVWVLVQQLGSQPEAAPSISLQTLDQGDTFRVIAADAGLDWSDFTATPCTTVPTGPVLAGQELAGYSGQVQLVHVPTNRLLYSYG